MKQHTQLNIALMIKGPARREQCSFECALRRGLTGIQPRGSAQAILTPPSQPISATPAEKLYRPTRPAEPRRGLARDAAFRHGHRSHQQLAPSSEFGSDCVYSAFQMR